MERIRLLDELNEIFSKFKDDPHEDCVRVKRLTEVIQALGRNPSMKDAEERIDELEAIGNFSNQKLLFFEEN